MSKIAIATLQGRNYGGRLQNYALLTLLAKNQHNVQSLYFGKENNPLYPTTLSRLKQYTIKEIVEKALSVYKERKHKHEILSLLQTRFSMFDSFIAEHLNRIKIQTNEDRNSLGDLFDVLVCGSDQIWNPNSIDDESFVGSNTGNIKRKISYAASIGRGSLSKFEAAYMIPRINALDAISVREQSAKKILEDCGVTKPIKVVLDPTLLLASEDWNQICSKRLIEEPYVFVYSFSDCKLKYQIVEQYKKQGKRVVFIPYARRVWNCYDGASPMQPLYDIGPREFLSLIKYADVVFTDSFHSSVFSLIFNKRFYVFERSNQNEKTSMNSRIYDLLSTFSLEKCLLNNSLPDKDGLIDYSYVNEHILQLREDSIKWLLNAVE